MLILSRREAECIYLGEDIVLTVVSLGNDKVRIGVQAPPNVRILRNELEVVPPTLPFDSTQSRPVANEPQSLNSIAQFLNSMNQNSSSSTRKVA